MSLTQRCQQRTDYKIGPATLFASRADQRFSFCLYVPTSYQGTGTKPYLLSQSSCTVQTG